MRYFTQELVSSLQCDGIGATKKWQITKARYESELKRIRPLLPSDAADVSTWSLHDGAVRRAIELGNSLLLDVDLTAGVDARHRSYYRFEVRGFKLLLGRLADVTDQWIVASEFDAPSEGRFILRLLTGAGELDLQGRDLIALEIPFGKSLAGEKSLVDNEQERAVLERVEALKSSNIKSIDIVKILNDAGISARYGKRWSIPEIQFAIRRKS